MIQIKTLLPTSIRTAICFVIFASLLPPTVRGQDKEKFPPISALQGLRTGSQDDSKLKVRSSFALDETQTKGALRVTVEVPTGWHIFSVTQAPGGPVRTEIPMKDNAAVRFTGSFQPDHEPHRAKSEFFPVTEETHEGTVIWTAPFELTAGTDPQQLVIEGEIEGQICSDQSCLPLETMDTTFAAAFDPAASYGSAPPAADGSAAPRVEGIAQFSVPLLIKNMGLGILGGLILNLMPCVLPVIGLKLMSFIEQSQGDRWQAFQLNIIYALGILSVFLVLATLASFLNMGWGEQFTNNTFKLSMVVLVFAMALSFLGVWEIPIPGFVGRGTSEQLASQEGASGAFFKGVFTTILATPCSGPFLGPVFGYTIKQPPVVTYVIMLSVGFGLALPYLVIGAFPSLMRWVPKPGAWMETFKQLMGFVLLGTTVFLISSINQELFLPTLTLMFGVWFGCWWIGRVPITASFDRKIAGWICGIASSVAIGFFAFNYLVPRHSYLDWTPYTPSALTAASQEGKTVMVEFTADWCPNCKLNMVRAIDTPRVGELVEQLGVVPMLADWSDKSEEIKQKLEELGSRSIPLLAIYPASAPHDPIILRDVLSEKTVLAAIQQAGPSAGTEVQTADAQIGEDFSQTSHSTAPHSPSL